MQNKSRCKWVNLNNPVYVKYHDNEWGIPRRDDNYLFEMLLLEAFQSGLSWECVLNKREAFRKAFDNFDYKKISKYDEDKIRLLCTDKDIIRNEKKIRAAVNNAAVFIDIQSEYGSFSEYIWSFTDGCVIKNNDGKVRTRTHLSDTVSNDLKRHGMKFIGSTTVYSYLQAIGVINDHDIDCCFR